MIADGNKNSECRTSECLYDSTDSGFRDEGSPDIFYVTKEVRAGKGLGTPDSPYTSIYYAMTKSTRESLILLLLEGEHHFKLETVTNLDDIYDPLNRQIGSFNSIYIKTALCSLYSTVQGCAKERATVYVDDKIKITAYASDFTIENVHFRGDNLVCNLASCKDCSVDTCKYCPYADELQNGKIISDKLQEIPPEQYEKYGKDCSTLFNNYSLIYAYSNKSITLVKVKFSNFMMGQHALIWVYDVRFVNMFLVDFERIIPGNKEVDAVIVITGTQYLSSDGIEFTYTGGSVMYLNDGFEINPVITQGGFLLFQADDTPLTIKMTDIQFSFNIYQNTLKNTITQKSFIYAISTDFEIELKNLKFSNNYSSLGLFHVYSYSRSWRIVSTIQISNVLFSKNSSKYGIIKLTLAYNKVNVKLSSLVFEKCVSTEAPMVSSDDLHMNIS